LNLNHPKFPLVNVWLYQEVKGHYSMMLFCNYLAP